MDNQDTKLDSWLKYFGFIGLDEADVQELFRTVLALVFTDLAASLALRLSLLDTLIHATIIAVGTIGTYLKNPYKKNHKKSNKKVASDKQPFIEVYGDGDGISEVLGGDPEDSTNAQPRRLENQPFRHIGKKDSKDDAN